MTKSNNFFGVVFYLKSKKDLKPTEFCLPGRCPTPPGATLDEYG